MISSSTDGGEIPEKKIDIGASGTGSPSEATVVLSGVSNTMEDLHDAFTSLDVCTDKFMNFPSQSEATKQEVEACSRKIGQHQRDMDALLKKMKSEFHDDIKHEVEVSVRSGLADWIREEVGKQVKEQVDEQIKEHLPESLQQQADESNRQLEEIKISLQNSEARMQNSFIQTNSIMDPLAPILRTNGEKSPLYPSNAWSLFNYDLESAKGLSKHYELTESDDLQMNFKQFLKHIGTSIDVVVSGDES